MMKVKLYGDGELKQLKDNDFLVIYRRRPFVSIETRFIKAKRVRLFYEDKKDENLLGFYYVTFIEWGWSKEIIYDQLIKYLNWSGYDDVTEWIKTIKNADCKRRIPEHGAFYKIELLNSNINEVYRNRVKYEVNEDYRGR